jgi:phosphoribosylformimino-5-aminoimidazole carboxamide ribotide isomerase
MATDKFSIIPAIDLMDGKCVRLSNGDYNKQTVYYDDPLIAAKKFEEAGLKRLHVVDLDGAKAGHVINLKTLEYLASNTGLEIDFGGGIKDEQSLQSVFDAGASLAAIGSIAVTGQAEFLKWLHKYGASRFFLGADVKDNKLY